VITYHEIIVYPFSMDKNM